MIEWMNSITALGDLWEYMIYPCICTLMLAIFKLDRVWRRLDKAQEQLALVPEACPQCGADLSHEMQSTQ